VSRILLYLHAASDPGALRAGARGLAELPQVLDGRLAVALMTPQQRDPLAVPADSEFLAAIDLVVELAAVAGEPLARQAESLGESLQAVLVLADRDRSHVYHDYQRCFQASGPKPFRYHYLMRRRADFSRADYFDYYTHHHYRFGVATPLADYYQGYADPEGTAAWAERLGVRAIPADNLSELRFDDVAAYLGSDVIAEVGPAAAADEEGFVDRASSVSFSMRVLLDTAAAQ
jgi:hypothetical protein